MRGFIFTLFCAGLIIICACSSDKVEELIKFNDATYNVVFEEKPEILNKKILSKGFEIGSIVSQKLGENNLVIVKISIKKDMKDLITSDTAFYVSEGTLIYKKLGANGAPVERGTAVLGFSSKSSMYWFQTRNKISELSDAAIIKARELYEKANQ